MTADLSEQAGCQRVVQAVQEQWGPIEILVNNAGIGSRPILGPWLI